MCGILLKWLGRVTLVVWSGVITFAQRAPVPAAYLDLYNELQSKIAAFDNLVSSRWNGSKYPVDFGAGLLGANDNRGRQLLSPQTRAGIRLELQQLQSLGVKEVTLSIGFPILYRPFFEFNGNPEDYGRFLEFYRELAADIHGRGLKMVVETSQLFPGPYSSRSGFRLADYYATLNAQQLAAGRSQVAVTIAKELHPDFLNLGSEPDTQAELNRKPELRRPATYAKMIGFLVRELRKAGASMPIGAGVGTWQKEGATLISALCSEGVDYIDLHVYAVNYNFLPNAIALTELAGSKGKRVGISEAWLLKERDSELGQIKSVSNPIVFARDAYSFWAPLDRAFLGALIKFSHWKRVLYLSPFWTNYFWSYTDYDRLKEIDVAQSRMQSMQIAAAALLRNRISETAAFYRDAIAGKSP